MHKIFNTPMYNKKRIKIFLAVLLFCHIIELPQNGIERDDSRKAAIRGRAAILSLNALKVGIGSDLYSSGNWNSVARRT